MKPTPEQEEAIKWWGYLVTGIGNAHASDWYREIKRTQGIEEAEIFRKRVNYINKKVIL